MLYVKVQPADNLSFIVVLSLSKLYKYLVIEYELSPTLVYINNLLRVIYTHWNYLQVAWKMGWVKR